MAIYPVEIASHSFAMTSINSSYLKATWYENKRNYIIKLESSTLWHDICIYLNCYVMYISKIEWKEVSDYIGYFSY